MSREDQRRTVRVQREELIKESIATYSKVFDRLPSLDLSERTLAKLVQLIINSREAAIQVLEEEIEAPLNYIFSQFLIMRGRGKHTKSSINGR